jgi:site-specific DNA-methyltransferase (adenine-specific)
MNKEPESIVYNEDCIIRLKQYPDNHFNLAIVDPPYGIGLVKTENGNWGQRKENKGNIDKETMWDFQRPSKEYFEELFRVSANQIIWVGELFY